MILNINHLHKTHGDKVLLDDVTFSIASNDRIGIIGLNGSGKSTLLKIVAGVDEAEIGNVETVGEQQLSYLPQNPALEPSMTIMEYILHDVKQADKEIALYEAKSILTKLELNDFDRIIGTLSGGEKRKVALACSLVKPSTLLILDEPTNHLDSDIVEWLEKYLLKLKKAILMVTHDRYFLDRISNKIIDLERGNITMYVGNYNRYLELKAEYMTSLATSERKLQSYLRKELEWIKRGARARATKDKKRVEKFEQLTSREKIVDKQITMESAASRLGNKIIEINGISKSYNNLLFKNFSLLLDKTSRIGIIGKNGTGKTTLLRIIGGEVAPDTGTIEIGETVKVGYFAQENDEFGTFARAIDYINNIATIINTKKGYITSSQMLENFLFDDPYIPIAKLSGGELRRLYLVGILMKAPNVLIFDEPTNDLDIQTLNVLEGYLDDFNGSVVVVSHDRYFLDKVVNEIYAFDDTTKEFTHYMGNFSDYVENRVIIKPSEEKVKKVTKTTKIKLTYLEQKEFENIENEMLQIEEAITEVQNQINENVTKYEIVKDLYSKLSKLEKELDEKFNRWEYLSNIHEASKSKPNS